MVICIAFISKTYSITAIFKCDGRTGSSWKRTQRKGLRGVLFDGEGAASGGDKGLQLPPNNRRLTEPGRNMQGQGQGTLRDGGLIAVVPTTLLN